MHKLKTLLVLPVIAMAFFNNAEAQSSPAESRHFEKEGLQFDYPIDWLVTERSDTLAHFVELAPEKNTAQLIVRWQFEEVLKCEVIRDWSQLLKKLAAPVASRIKAKIPAATSWEKTHFGQLEIAQIHLHGLLDNVPVTGEICLAVARQRYLFLVYVRADTNQSAEEAWGLFRRTLTVAPEAARDAQNETDDRILNGKLLHQPMPRHLTGEMAGPRGGDVRVEVLINESGKVIKACQLGGGSALEQAAMDAEFSPTTRNGKPIRVTRMIVYHFPAPPPSAH